MSFQPTHTVAPGGLPAFAGPDPAPGPVARLDAGLAVEVREQRADWAQVHCSNGWEAWVDARRLVASAPAPAVPGAPIAPGGPAAPSAPAAPQAPGAWSSPAPGVPSAPTAPSGPWGAPVGGAPGSGTPWQTVTKPKPRVAHPVGGWLLLGGAAAVVIGSLLPWARVSAFGFEETVSGTEGDGVLTILLMGVAAGLAFMTVRPAGAKRGLVIAALVLAALTLLIAVIDIVNVNRVAGDLREDLGVDADLAFGLILVGIGAAASLAGAIVSLAAGRVRR